MLFLIINLARPGQSGLWGITANNNRSHHNFQGTLIHFTDLLGGKGFLLLLFLVDVVKSISDQA